MATPPHVPADAAVTVAHPAIRRAAPSVMLWDLSGPLNTLLTCGAARKAEDGMIELLLSGEEARQGGMVTISMRVPLHCPTCDGTVSATCTRCGGSGVIEELFSAWLAIPPDAADGTVLAPSVSLPGMIRQVRFRVRTRRPLIQRPAPP